MSVFARPLGVEQTEVHWAYFAHEDDDEAMYHHRVRQASNFLGPSGLVSLEDASAFSRIQKGIYNRGKARYLKGARKGRDLFQGGQNDEALNIVSWDFYRELMGFTRGGA